MKEKNKIGNCVLVIGVHISTNLNGFNDGNNLVSDVREKITIGQDEFVKLSQNYVKTSKIEQEN